MILDLNPDTEQRTNAAINSAPAGTTIRLLGEHFVTEGLMVKGKTAPTLDLTDAQLTQTIVRRTQFGKPLLTINRCTDTTVTGGRLVGANVDAQDGVGARLEGYAGVLIGGGCKNVTVENMRIEQTWGDAVMVAGRGLSHNHNIILKALDCFKIGRHGISVRDVVGLEVADSTFAAIRRLWFDHEGTPRSHFTNVDVHHNISPAGGLGLWVQVLPKAGLLRIFSECGDVTFRDHRLMKGNFRAEVRPGGKSRSVICFKDLVRTATNPTGLYDGKDPLVDVRGWTDVTIERVEGMNS